jgi:hypothetical protein
MGLEVEMEVEQEDPSIRPVLTKTTFNVFSEYGDCLAIDEEVTLQPATVETFGPPERLVVCARQSHSHA